MNNSWGKVLKTFTDRRMLVIFMFGVSGGLPLIMVSSNLGFWLRTSDVSISNIGLTALIGVFFNIKFLWSPIVDIIKIPYLKAKLGQRRSWLIFSQLLLFISVLFLAGTDPSESLVNTVIAACFVAFFAATQDIIIDAFRIDSLDKEEQAVGAMSYVYGYRIGMYIVSAIGLLLSQYIGWSGVYYFSAFAIIIGVIAALLSSEPKVERKTDFKNYSEFFLYSAINPFKNFAEHKYWAILLIFVVAYKFPGAFLGGGLMSAFYLDMDFTEDQIFWAVKTFGFAATIFGLFIGAVLATKIGLFKSLLVDIILQAVTNLLFIPLVFHTGNVYLLTVAVCADNLASSMGTVVLVAFISSLCNKEFSATQYALLSSLAAFGRTLLAANSGWIVEDIGWTNFYLLTFASAIPALLLLPYIAKYLREEKITELTSFDKIFIPIAKFSAVIFFVYFSYTIYTEVSEAIESLNMQK